MFLGAIILFALVASWALGARLTRLGDVRLRGTGLVFGALGSQLVIFTALAPLVPRRLETPLHMLTYVALLAFLALNVRQRGLWLAALGLAANATVIFANGGRMPVTLKAWETAGRDPQAILAHGFYNNNVLAGPHTHLGWLGDVFALPASVPLATAVSVGDLLILFGMIAFIYRACEPSAGVRGSALLEPLRFGDFRRLLAGRAVSKLGDLLTMTALVTWLFARSHSIALVSAFLIARIVSVSAGGLLAAPLLNRMPRFRMLSIVEIARGLLMLATLPFAIAGMVAPVVGLVCVSAIIGAATNPSAASLVPELLPEHALHVGNSLHGVSRNMVMAAGAALGSFTVITLGIGPALAIDAASFAVGALLYGHFATGQRPQDASIGQPVARRQLLTSLLRDRVVFGVSASFVVVTAAMGLLNASLPALFAHQIGQPRAYGYAMAAIGAGLLCGELLTGFIRQESVARRSVALAFLLSALSIVVLSRSQLAPTAYLLLFLLGASDGSTEIVRDTLFQRRLPGQLRAGTFAIAGSFQNAGMVSGLALAPVLLGHASPAAALTVVAILCLAGAVIAGLFLIQKLPAGDETLATANAR